MIHFWLRELLKQKNKHGKDYVNRKDLLYKDFVMQEGFSPPLHNKRIRIGFIFSFVLHFSFQAAPRVLQQAAQPEP